MNILSKQLSLGLLAVVSSLILGGTASSALVEELSGNTFADFCFNAKEKAIQANDGGYVIQTGKKRWGQGKLVAFLQGGVSAESGCKIAIGGTKCEGGPNFCAEPESENILYQDELVRVVLKPKYGGATGDKRTPTDILIIPIKHYDSSHALDAGNIEHRALLDRIEAVAEQLAGCLDGEDKTYTLQTRNGCQQGVPHLHVHFKSEYVLKIECLELMREHIKLPHSQPNLQPDQIDSFKENMISFSPQQDQPTESSFEFLLKAFIGILLGIAAIAAYGIYSWWRKK